MKEKIKSIEKKIQNDFDNLNIELFFDDFKNYQNGRNMGFIEWYNKIVLDKGYKKGVDFCEFDNGSHWATTLGRFNRDLLDYFQKNQKGCIFEIKIKKDITEFYSKYCKAGSKITNSKRNEVVFCSKLFHTVLPDEYPPVDSHVMEKFGLLGLRSDIDSVLIIKEAYENYIKDHTDKMNTIRMVLSKKKFLEFRAGELSGMRILDMYYWHRERTLKNEFNTE